MCLGTPTRQHDANNMHHREAWCAGLHLKVTMLQKFLLPTLLLALSPSVFAAPPPVGGGQLQQIPPVPRAPGTAPEFDVKPTPPQPGLPSEAQTQRILVTSVQVTGVSAFSEAELLAQTGFQPATEMSLNDLRALAGKIGTFYRSKGYFVAQAYLPVQEIKDGAVTIAVSADPIPHYQPLRGACL